MVKTIIKMAVGTTAQIGVGIMVDQAAQKLIPQNAGTAIKICCITGETMFSGMTGMAVQAYTDQFIDELANLGGMFGRRKEDEKK